MHKLYYWSIFTKKPRHNIKLHFLILNPFGPKGIVF